MKKLIFLFIFVCFSILSYSQTYTKKYNSIYSRYEYFNSGGVMVGYEKYNSMYQRWDYYTVEANNNTYEVPPVTSSFDFDRIDRAMSAKQNRYDSNVNKIHNKISSLSRTIDSYEREDYELNAKLHSGLNSIIKTLNSKNYDFSSNSVTNNVLGWLDSEFNRMSTNVITELNRMKLPIYHTVSDGVIWDVPDISTGSILAIATGRVLVTEKTNDVFYKVTYNGITGYMTRAILFKQ